MSESASSVEDNPKTDLGSEKLLETDADFLGTKGLGFDLKKYSELHASLENRKLQKRQVYEADRIERRQSTDQLRKIFGKTAYSSTLDSLDKEVKNLESEIEDEEVKKSDSEDLSLAVAIVHGDVKPVRNMEISAKLSPADSFTETDERAPTPSEIQNGKHISEEVWFHTTRHLDRLIETGGLATQSWIEKHDPEYFRLHQENSSKNNAKGIDYDKWSPMREDDKDRIFFSVDTHFDEMNYGNNVIAYAPEDLLADNNLYFYRGAFGNFPYERVVSDVCDVDSDSIPSNGDSDLLLPLINSYIAVPKTEYQKTCIKLLKNGYSEEWVRRHTLSYRGNIYEHKGQILAAEEIKRRIKVEREGRPKTQFAAVGNPKAKLKDFPNVCQLVTIAS